MTMRESTSEKSNILGRYGPAAVASASSFLFGLAASRILYEGLFPDLNLLGQPIAALFVGLVMATVGWLFWRHLAARLRAPSTAMAAGDSNDALSPSTADWTAAVVFLPLALNLAYLFDQTVDLATGRFLFFCSIWLTVLFTSRLQVKTDTWRWLSVVLLLAALLPIYLATLGRTVGMADTFEFQVVVPRLGIVHPTGYPLYLLLSKLFTFIPLGTVAWRVNLATAVYALVAVTLLYVLGWRLTRWSLPSLLAAFLFGLTPTFWSQAVQAEIYSLHALFVVATLLVMRELGNWRIVPAIHQSSASESQAAEPSTEPASPVKSGRTPIDPFWLTVILAFILGLGLTNHLTMVILIPPALLAIWFAYRAGRYGQSRFRGFKALGVTLAAFVSPLILYAYLPIRWAAVNGEPMGFNRFLEWVLGGRFQGALQLTAWLDDGTRYDIIGRLFTEEWFFFWTMLLILVGAAYLLLWQWRYGLIVILIWLGYVFYGLNYIVPDLSVFVIPAQLIMALWWTVGVVAALDLIFPKPGQKRTLLLEVLFLLAGLVPLLVTAGDQTLESILEPQSDESVRWAQAVLDLPLEQGAAILADSDKFPPLYYLQQAEGIRPDLDIIVLPDEAAYRAELDSRLAQGKAVHLARFLPGLESLYHLNSMGPLVRVSQTPQTTLPSKVSSSDIAFGPIKLLAYEFRPRSPYGTQDSALTLYWQTDEAVDEVLQVYARWQSESANGDISAQHPANNSYPTVAWKPGEIISDFHILPRPITNETIQLQAALAPPFTVPEELVWQTIAEMPVMVDVSIPESKEIRVEAGPIRLDTVSFEDRLRPLEELSVFLGGSAASPGQLSLALVESGRSSDELETGEINWHIANPLHTVEQSDGSNWIWSTEIDTNIPEGGYDLIMSNPPSRSRCGWFSRAREVCVLGQVELSGVPLPEGATNFGDTIALLSVDVPEKNLLPGGQLPLTLTWQALAAIEKDYTVFVQILDSNDQIIGQIDSWPQQGTFGTSRWLSGQVVEDPYLIPLKTGLKPGSYELHVGLYLLETLRRLPVFDESGLTIDDKVVISGFQVSE